MFSFFSQVRVKRVLFTGLVLVLLAGFLGGCKTEPADDGVNKPGSLPNGLVGKWATAYDSFEITTGAIKYDDGGYDYGYEGTIEFVSNYDSKSGLIIVKYTTGGNATKPYHAIYYLNFTTGTVELNNTSDSTVADYNADTATLEQAKEKFTKGSMGNYMDFSYSTPYTKQN